MNITIYEYMYNIYTSNGNWKTCIKKKHIFCMKANFLAVGLVVRSTIIQKMNTYLRYTHIKKKTKYNDIKYTIYKFIMQSILHNKMLFYFCLFGIFFLIWYFFLLLMLPPVISDGGTYRSVGVAIGRRAQEIRGTAILNR